MNRGFTLIELLVVIFIFITLASVVLASLSAQNGCAYTIVYVDGNGRRLSEDFEKARIMSGGEPFREEKKCKY